MTRTLFSNGLVFDGRDGTPAEADIVVEDGRILDVGVGLDGDQIIDVSGRSVIPGLFDCHTHVLLSHVDFWRLIETPFSYRFYEAARNLATTLALGITSIRDAGGADLGVKQAVVDGLIPGPRMQIAINMISQTGGHADGWVASGGCVHTLFPVHPGSPPTVVDGPEEVRKAVRQLLRAGADVIKVATSGGVLSSRDDPRHPHFRDDELEVLVAEAAAAGAAVMAHAQATDGIKAGLRAGIRSVEHGIFLDDEGIELLLRRDAFLVPTLVAPVSVAEAVDLGVSLPASVREKLDFVLSAHEDSFRRALAAGVNIAMGSDSGIVPHGTNLRELELMVKYGMSPAAAFRAATSDAARLLGVSDDRGTIEPGKRADLVVVSGDPLDFATLEDRIQGVYLDGRAALRAG
ncbi:MAG: amidohydrolase family protein [Actinomycetota bacterium]